MIAKTGPINETALVGMVLRYLRVHKRMAWVQRMNTGVARRYVKFGFKGCSDLIGQTIDGRFVALEGKAKNGIISEEQQLFIDKVKRYHGLAGVCRSIEDVDTLLATV